MSNPSRGNVIIDIDARGHYGTMIQRINKFYEVDQMIIDLILDRKDGDPYTGQTFYDGLWDYYPLSNPIMQAMEQASEESVKHTLKQYIDKQEYNPTIKQYIDSVNWL